MKTNRPVLLTALLAAVAALALAGCGSGNSGTADAGKADRQAFYQVKGTEICVGDRNRQLGLTLKFENSTSSNGNGPFALEGNWCGTNSLVVRADVTNPDGSNVFRVSASNPEIGRPDVRITCRYGSTSDPDYSSVLQSFSDGDTKTFSCTPYTIEVIREPDGDELKHFQVWVTRS